jgi:hypothetical protein
MDTNVNLAIVNAILSSPETLSVFIASVKENDPKTWDTLHSAACLRYIENNEATIEDKAIKYLMGSDLRHVARAAAYEYIFEHEDEVREIAVKQYLDQHNDYIEEAAVQSYIEDNEEHVRSEAAEQYLNCNEDEVRDIAVEQYLIDEPYEVRDLAASKLIEDDLDGKIRDLAVKMYIKENEADVQNDAVRTIAKALNIEQAIADLKANIDDSFATMQKQIGEAIAKLYI